MVEGFIELLNVLEWKLRQIRTLIMGTRCENLYKELVEMGDRSDKWILAYSNKDNLTVLMMFYNSMKASNSKSIENNSSYLVGILINNITLHTHGFSVQLSREKMPSISRKELAEKLIDAGEKLSSPPSSIDELLELLDNLEYMLGKVEQAPPKSMLEALLPSMRALVANELLRHRDAAVRVSVTACNNEIMRITAPNPPYEDEEMKEIFQMTLETYEKLSHMSSRCYKKAVSVLDTVAKFRSCLLMLDLACDDLIVDVFDCFLQTIRSDHPHDVFTNMETVMTLLIDGDEFVPWDLLRTLLNSVKKGNKLASPMSWKLGEKVIKNCAVKLKRFLLKAVDSLGVDLNEYAEFVSFIVQTSTDTLEENVGTTSDKRMVASELVPACPSDTAQNRNNEASAEENLSESLAVCCQIKQSESNDIRRNEETGKSEMNSGTASRKRVWKPNSSMNPDEGYEHYWIRRGRRSSKLPRPQKSHDKVKASDTPHRGKDLGEQLVGSRINVWWPQDKTFYEGVVDSFDPLKKRHKVVYTTDGVEEILNLEKQRWELIGK